MRVLDADVGAARTRAWVLGAIAVALTGLAWWLDGVLGISAHGVALLVGVGVGLLVARLRAQRQESALRSSWREWMRMARAAETVPEVHQRVQGRGLRGRVFLLAAAMTVAWALELLLFFLALNNETSRWWSIVAIVANGALMAGLATMALRAWSWTRELRHSIQSMIDSGEIGTWGVME